MTSNMKNVTFSLPAEYIDKLRDYSKSKIIPSMNAGIMDALDIYFKMLEKKKAYEIMKEAASDKQFLNDIRETMSAYNFSDKENNGGNGNWY